MAACLQSLLNQATFFNLVYWMNSNHTSLDFKNIYYLEVLFPVTADEVFYVTADKHPKPLIAGSRFRMLYRNDIWFK